MLEPLIQLAAGIDSVLTPYNLTVIFVAGMIGTIVGALPGLGPSSGIALMLPLTFGMPHISGMCLLTGVYLGTMYGGAITSILINTPGDAPAIVTCLEGYPMMRKGRGGMALGISALSSFVGGTFGLIVLIFFAPVVADYAIYLGAPEYFMLMVVGLSTIVLLAGDNAIKAMVAALFGALISTFGSDYVSGYVRFAFLPELIEGIDFVAIIIGMYGLSEVYFNIEKNLVMNLGKPSFKMREYIPGMRETIEATGPTLRGSALGTFIGILPGAGATIATFLAYALERKVSRHPEEFGHGSIAGLAGPEAANNAAVPGALIPLITLGIPGSGGTAIMLGALIIFGMQPGPLLMVQSGDVVWGMVGGLVVGNVFLLLSNILLIPFFINLLRVLQAHIPAVVVGLCLVGSFSLNYSLFNVWIAVVFGMVGYLMQKHDYPSGPFILAVVLTPLTENYFRQSIMLSQGSWGIFVERPVSLILVLLMTATIVIAIMQKQGLFKRRAKPTF